MCADLKQALLTNFDKINLTADIPSIFSGLVGKDANFEISASNTLQNLKLFYEDNLVNKMFAVIFAHTEILGRILGRKEVPTYQYRDAMDRAEKVKKMLVEVLNVEDTVICKNFSKKQMIDKFTELTEKANTYVSVDGSHQAFFCVNVGFSLNY